VFEKGCQKHAVGRGGGMGKALLNYEVKNGCQIWTSKTGLCYGLKRIRVLLNKVLHHGFNIDV